MNQTLQAERDLRARIKARLEHRCLWHNCQEHGPMDAHDVMLVSYIYTAEHFRHYGTGSPLTTTAAEVDSDKCPECGGWFDAQVVNPGCRRCVARLSSRMEFKDEALKPVEGWEACSECGSDVQVLLIRGIDRPIFMCCSCLCKLTDERFRLRKEVEEYKQSLRLMADSRDRWKREAGESDEAANRYALERNEAIAKLSRFQWKPVPLKKPDHGSAEDALVIWTNNKDAAKPFSIQWLSEISSHATHFIPTEALPPLPSPQESEEDRDFAQWEATLGDGACMGDTRDLMKAAFKAGKSQSAKQPQ